MYVLLYTATLISSTYFGILRASDNNLINGLLFGGLFVCFVILRFVILKVTMPAPPPMPNAPSASTSGTIVGFFVDVFLGGAGFGDAIGQIYDEEITQARVTGYTANLEEWASSYEQDIVEPLVGMAMISIFVAFLGTVACAYGVGVRLW